MIEVSVRQHTLVEAVRLSNPVAQTRPSIELVARVRPTAAVLVTRHGTEISVIRI